MTSSCSLSLEEGPSVIRCPYANLCAAEPFASVDALHEHLAQLHLGVCVCVCVCVCVLRTCAGLGLCSNVHGTAENSIGIQCYATGNSLKTKSLTSDKAHNALYWLFWK